PGWLAITIPIGFGEALAAGFFGGLGGAIGAARGSFILGAWMGGLTSAGVVTVLARGGYDSVWHFAVAAFVAGAVGGAVGGIWSRWKTGVRRSEAPLVLVSVLIAAAALLLFNMVSRQVAEIENEHRSQQTRLAELIRPLGAKASFSEDVSSVILGIGIVGEQFNDDRMQTLTRILIDKRDVYNRLVLSVVDTAVTDRGLESLRELVSLEVLDLQGNSIGDVGLKSLQGLTNLHSLNISHTKITGGGLQYLKALTRLMSLELGKTKVDDE